MEWQFDESITYTLTGLGWLIAMTCILRKYIWKSGTFSCFLSEMVTVTFASITLVLIIDFSLFVYIDLKEEREINATLTQDISSHIISSKELLVQHSSLIEKHKELQIGNRNLVSENSALKKRLSEYSTNTIIHELRSEWLSKQAGNNKIITRDPIDKYFGRSNEYMLDSLKLRFVANNDRVSCVLEGELIHCEEN